MREGKLNYFKIAFSLKLEKLRKYVLRFFHYFFCLIGFSKLEY